MTYFTNTADSADLVKMGGRLGKFFMKTSDLMLLCKQYNDKPFKEMIILRATFRRQRGAVEYVAIHPRFQQIEPYQKIPVYQVINGNISLVATGV